MTTKVYLTERTRKNPSGKKVSTWALLWAGPGGKQCTKGLGKKSRLTKKQANELRHKHEADINEGRAPVDKGPGVTLGEFRPFYLKHRRRGDAPKIRQAIKTHIKLSDQTIACHDMALRYLIQQFGETRRLDSITQLDGEEWHARLAAGDLAAARTRARGMLSENSIRSITRSIKAVFGWARSNDMIRVNPFQDFVSTNLQTRPNPNVPLEDFRRLCEVAPQPWRALFALCRLAGLRRSEAACLPWNGTAIDRDGMELPVGIDFDAKRIRVVGKGDRYREVPIRPELDDILVATLTEARRLRFSDNDAKVVHSIKDDKNLIYQIVQFAEAAGLTLWRKPYQSLRSSCENEWKALGIAEATYLAWIGHGVEVSRRHYVSPLESEFATVTRVDTRPALHG